MRLTLKLASAALAMLALGALPATFVRADSSLHKLGNAVQYPFRKAGENASMNVHKGMHHNSVEADRPHNARFVVKPNGSGVYKGPNSSTKHHRHRHHHHHVAH